MPLRVQNWNDPMQRMLYYLDRDLDRLVKNLHPPESKQSSFIIPKKESVEKKIAPKQCCDNPDIVYNSDGHDWVCRNCAQCKHAAFEEVGTVVQFEQRENCAPLESIYCPYDRNKHFKKILRDVTNMHIRIPKKLVNEMRISIKGPMTVPKVRQFLKFRKLYHYYTSANNIASALGDSTTRIKLDTRAFDVMCMEADAISTAFDNMKEQGLIKRKNFVNANVLILDIATRKFKLPEIARHLRLPRKDTRKQHEQILQQIYDHMGRS